MLQHLPRTVLKVCLLSQILIFNLNSRSPREGRGTLFLVKQQVGFGPGTSIWLVVSAFVIMVHLCAKHSNIAVGQKQNCHVDSKLNQLTSKSLTILIVHTVFVFGCAASYEHTHNTLSLSLSFMRPHPAVMCVIMVLLILHAPCRKLSLFPPGCHGGQEGETRAHEGTDQGSTSMCAAGEIWRSSAVV